MAESENVKAAPSAPASNDLTFVSETKRSSHLVGLFFIGLGVVIAGVGLLQPETILWHLLGGALLAGLGALVFYSVSGGYPRLRLHGPALWVENRWRRGPALDLNELGKANVLEVRTVLPGRDIRELCLCFLRREEEQALLDAGRPMPTEASAYYRTMTLATLIPFDRTRAEEIAAVVNAHRPTWTPDLTDAARQILSRGPGDRHFVYLVGLFSMAAILLLIVFLLRSAS
jgi:hypothetical protein